MKLDYGRTFAQNMFAKLFEISWGKVQAYHSDLGWDAITLSRAKPGDLYLWGWREHGTHMVHVYRHGWQDKDIRAGFENAKQFLKLNGVIHPDNAYLLFVTKKHNNELSCEGHAWRLLESVPADADYAQKLDWAIRQLGVAHLFVGEAAANLYATE